MENSKEQIMESIYDENVEDDLLDSPSNFDEYVEDVSPEVNLENRIFDGDTIEQVVVAENLCQCQTAIC